MNIVRRFGFVALATVGACGGSAPAPDSPRATGETKVRSQHRVEEPTAPARSTVACDDGSCFACGDAVCLSGFYCTAGRVGRGCAWLPSCAGKPTCACIAPTLRDDPSCTCQEKEGGVYVACDGIKP